MKFRALAIGSFLIGMGVGIAVHEAWGMPEEGGMQQEDMAQESPDSEPRINEASPTRAERTPGFSEIIYSEENETEIIDRTE